MAHQTPEPASFHRYVNLFAGLGAFLGLALIGALALTGVHGDTLLALFIAAVAAGAALGAVLAVRATWRNR